MAVALSGVFAVTFSMVFAYVADCTSESERTCSYGLVCMYIYWCDLWIISHDISCCH